MDDRFALTCLAAVERRQVGVLLRYNFCTMRRRIASGSTFEEKIGYSRAAIEGELADDNYLGRPATTILAGRERFGSIGPPLSARRRAPLRVGRGALD